MQQRQTEVEYLSENFFNLVFMDCEDNINVGFNDNTYGEDYRRVACRVFSYLSHIINAENDFCDMAQAGQFVNIEFVNSLSDRAQELQPATLAAASAYYKNIHTGGLVEGMVWEEIMNSSTNDIPFNNSVFHGGIVFNIDAQYNNTTVEYYTDVADPSPSIPQFDLFTVLLHEAIHTLGFASLMGVNGDWYIDGQISYTLFDFFLKLKYENDNFIPAIKRWDFNPFTWIINTDIIDPENDLYNSCLPGTPDLPDMFFVASSYMYPIYTGDTHVGGRSFSHLAPDCGGPYVMQPFIEPGERIELQSADLGVLCGLGYTISGSPEDCNCEFEAVDDYLDCNSAPLFVFDLCDKSISISIEILLENDDADDSEFTFVGENPWANGFFVDVQVVDGIIYATPCGILDPENGILNYETFSETCNQPSNPATIHIKITNNNYCASCSFASNPTAPIDGGYNQNSCNLICNPEVINDPLVSDGSFDCYGCDSDVPGWRSAIWTSDITLNSVFPNSFSLGMLIRNNDPNVLTEAVYNSVPNLSEGNYFLGYHLRVDQENVSPIEGYSFHTAWVDEEFRSQFGQCGLLDGPQSFSELDFNLGQYSLLHSTTGNGDSGGVFERVGSCISIEEELNDGYLAFFPDGNLSIPWSEYYLMLDQVELLPDNFNAGNDKAIFCGETVELGGDAFCMLSGVTIQYIWKDEGGNSLLTYRIKNLNTGVQEFQDGQGQTLGSVPQLGATPNATSTYYLHRSVLATEGNLSLTLCETVDEVTVTVFENLPDAGFQVSFSECDNGAPEMIFSAYETGGTHSWTFGDGSGSGNSAYEVYTYSSSGAFSVTHTVTTDCGTSVLTQLIAVPSCLDCSDCTSITIGQSGVTTTLDDAITNNLLPSGQVASGITRCIEGTLEIESGDIYAFENCTLKMGKGAKIVVEGNAALTIDESVIYGCDYMWEGIEVLDLGYLGIVNQSMIEDAQFGVFLPEHAKVVLINSAFLKNFVSVYKPAGAKDVSLVCSGNIFDGGDGLKPFIPLSSLPADIPTQGDLAWSGIWINSNTPMNFQANTFRNLTTGLVIKKSDFLTVRSRFVNILNNYSEYPVVNLDAEQQLITGCAIFGGGDGDNTMQAIRNPEFTNCRAGIRLRYGQMNAHTNIMDDVVNGILLENVGFGGAIVRSNDISDTDNGITVLVNEPGAPVSIRQNSIGGLTDASDFAINLNSILGANGNFEISNNTVNMEKGYGIFMRSCREAEVFDNHIDMTSTDAKFGMRIQGTQDCIFRENTVNGAGTTGTLNQGISVVSSPGNTYCCNSVDNTSYGVYFDGPCQSENNFRGTTFGNHGTSLYLKNSSTILGSQAHMENQWIGSGAAVYDGVSPAFASFYPFVVDVTQPNGDASNGPPSYMPSGWFELQENPDQLDVCDVEECETDGFVEDSPDSKRIAKGELDTVQFADVVQWELRRYLFGRLKGLTLTDTVLQNFMAAQTAGLIGSFDSIDVGLVDLFAYNSTILGELDTNLQDIVQLLDEIEELDSLLLASGGVPWTAWETDREDLEQDALALALRNDTLWQSLLTYRSTTANALRTRNQAIGTYGSHAKNLQEVNDLLLSYIYKGMSDWDANEIDALELIAGYCPLTDGNAVFMARALLVLATGEVAEYDDDTNCYSSSPYRAAPTTTIKAPAHELFTVYPIPAKEELNIQWAPYLDRAVGLNLYDIYGKHLRSIWIEPGVGNYQMQINDLATGIYFLQIDTGDTRQTKKVIIN